MRVELEIEKSDEESDDVTGIYVSTTICIKYSISQLECILIFIICMADGRLDGVVVGWLHVKASHTAAAAVWCAGLHFLLFFPRVLFAGVGVLCVLE